MSQFSTPHVFRTPLEVSRLIITYFFTYCSCGLWVLLHSLSVRVGDGESQTAFTDICNFIHNFFRCDECRQHFYEMCSK